jgi:hypothetical protein
VAFALQLLFESAMPRPLRILLKVVWTALAWLLVLSGRIG